MIDGLAGIATRFRRWLVCMIYATLAPKFQIPPRVTVPTRRRRAVYDHRVITSYFAFRISPRFHLFHSSQPRVPLRQLWRDFFSSFFFLFFSSFLYFSTHIRHSCSPCLSPPFGSTAPNERHTAVKLR